MMSEAAAGDAAHPSSIARTGDLATMPLDAVLARLEVSPDKGLSTDAVRERLGRYGPNALPEHEVGLAQKILRHFTGPIAYMIEAAAIVSAILGRWDDFVIIAGLLLFNAGLELWQDMKASNALAALKKGLALKAAALRDGKVAAIDATTLVPGDIVDIRLGAIVPADLRLIGEGYLLIDQAALTGESLPVTRKAGDQAYSGSVVKQGAMRGVVIATGASTFFGRTAKLVAGAGAMSHTQKAVLQIGNFLIAVAVVLALIMVAVRVYRDIVVGDDWGVADALNILQFVLILLIASIPVAMPAVFSITMALGALALSREKAIVSRLAAIEEMAGVDILCSDKTGTLTKNQLTLGEPILLAAKDAQDVVLAAALASKPGDRDAIDDAVIAALKDAHALDAYRCTNFIPFDPVSKRTQATVVSPQGAAFTVAKGAPQAIVALAQPSADVAGMVEKTVADLASRGYRALAVARSGDSGKSWALLGILPMFDPPRDDSRATIERAEAKGVRVKMVTGDDTAIAREIARQLGLGTNIIPAAEAFPPHMDPNNVPPAIADAIETADGFARVFPEHKYAIVKALQQRGHIVAMTGDGVNDAPALKQADCGTAVSGATDAARSAAALILTAPGLSVINNAIDEARRIFGRITSYTIYRVALTMDIMALVVLSTIFLDFQPLTAIMIVIMSLLDDVPIMSRLRQHPGRGASDPLAHAASPRHGDDARPVLGGAILRPAADRNGGTVRSTRAGLVRLVRPGPAAVRDVPATRRRRPPAAVRHPHRQMVLPAPLPGATAGDRNRADPGSGGADVRARVARAAHPLDADRLGLAVQSTLVVRTRRRAPRRREAARRGHRAVAAQRPIGQRAAAAAGADRRAALGHDPEKWVPVFGKDHAPTIARAGDNSKKSHPALAIASRLRVQL
jgi:H+-transporting ATPase